VPVTWRWGGDDNAGENNAVRFASNDSVVLRAGRLAQPIRACTPDPHSPEWPPRLLVVIATPYDDPAARQLAIRLLDRGSADQVLLGADWAEHLGRWLGPSAKLNDHTQLLVVLPETGAVESARTRVSEHATGPWAVVSTDDFAGLAEAITFWKEGIRPIGQIKQLRVQSARGEVWIAGGPRWQRDDRTGIEWVSVCPGTFTMGADKDDKMARKDERVDPPRIVTLSRFQIARTETTHQQYKRLRTAHPQDNTFPFVDINWKQAREFCQDAGGDLPSEAQWEYAARGGSRSRWSFGDDEEQLGNYAWFNKNASGQVHEVTGRLPNPFGLYDMHGNVWEWVRDWYSDYTSGISVDPTGPRSGEYRVLRGGSFNFPPGYLRSAGRVNDYPGAGGGDNGFRCVRVPPQHAAQDAMQRLSGLCAPHPSPSVPVARRPSGRANPQLSVWSL
jgi:formylglycine-generating enzyme required for sulfatase activity